MGHVVWDWNGTLLDDFHLTVEAVNRSIDRFGLGAITAEQYRDHYTRPVKRFYEALLGRVVTDLEWDELNATYHDHYFELARTAELAADALEALALFDRAGWSQSVLSMAPHDWLVETISRLGITSRFIRVEGMTGAMGARKAPFMQAHLEALGVPDRVVVIGDTPDDAEAAHHVGAIPVLFDGGSHHTVVLDAVGVPVQPTLVDAARVVLGAVQDPPPAS